MRKSLLIGALIALCACKAQAPATPAAPAAPATPAAVETPSSPATPATVASPATTAVANTPAFVDKVWRVQASSAVEPGTTYTFLGDGTLVIDSPNGTPLHGSWSYDNEQLTMVEEGMRYPTDILALDADMFRIRSHNPGGAVEITLVPAPGAPPPAH
jgi:hypothetical protein